MLLTREQLQERLFALHRASLELVKDVSLDTLLERIAATACEQADARYAALDVINADGESEKLISVEARDGKIKRIERPPLGRGFLEVPIRSAEGQIGKIYLTEKIGADEFSSDDEMIIQMFATYAAAAIANARLIERMKERDAALTRRNADMTLLNDIASTLTSSLDLDKILDRTLELVMDYMQVEAGEIFLLEDDRATLRLALHRGQAAGAFWSQKIFRVGEGHPGRVAETGKTHVISNLAKDDYFKREAVIKAGFQQVVSIPLISGERVMGVMSIATRSVEPLDDRSAQMLTAVGAWAGLAIENARLHDNARRLAVLEERNRIGMDLHDGIIQSIYGVGLGLEGAKLVADEDPAAAKEKINAAIGGLNQAIRDLRAYILDLRPRQLGKDGLISGIKRLIAEYRANTFSEVEFTQPDSDLKDLTPIQALALFHICQEALANAAKHAKAGNVQISLWTTADRILLEIRDDGNGFNTDDMSSFIGHGLANMETRARSAGGELDIASAQNEGTTVLVWIPR
ncbi:MAG: GAF domain-containing sensor histidine kinase [Anaerolineales bacterium]|nr:GAF domain-containing sensor histidine kinase [Anaerolineales bacterium]